MGNSSHHSVSGGEVESQMSIMMSRAEVYIIICYYKVLNLQKPVKINTIILSAEFRQFTRGVMQCMHVTSINWSIARID